jgi:hypothetical protein
MNTIQARKRTFNKLNTAYDVCTKCESGEYFMYPRGPSSSRTKIAQACADECTRAKKWPMSIGARSSAFCSPKELRTSIA